MAKNTVNNSNYSIISISKPVSISLGDLGMAEGFVDAEAHFDSYGHLKSLQLKALRSKISGVEFELMEQINPFVLEDFRKEIGEEIAQKRSEAGPHGS
jgi:hypothetical protein